MVDPALSKPAFRDEGLRPPFAGTAVRRQPPCSAEETALSKTVLPCRAASVHRGRKGNYRNTGPHPTGVNSKGQS